MEYDVAIVGGGAAGLSCALTLVSAKGRGWTWADERRYLLIDAGGSDLRNALLNNVPGVAIGTPGSELLKRLRSQIESLGGVDLIKGRVVKILKGDSGFSIETKKGDSFKAKEIVLATGFHGFDIEGLELKVVDNPKSPKPGRIMIEHDGDYLAAEGIWVAGLLAGVSSMFAAAAGTGVQVAINILSKWAGSPVVVHDVPG